MVDASLKVTKFMGQLGLLSCWVTGPAHACSCDPISPSAGFDRAQYVFTGKIVTAEPHSWVVDVDRVWKGKLGRTIKLMDIYGSIDCEFFFQLGKSYLFFAIIAKGGREVFYHPKCAIGRGLCRPLAFARRKTKPCG